MSPPYIPSPRIVVDPTRPEVNADIDVEFSLQRGGGGVCDEETVSLCGATLNRPGSGDVLVDLDLEVPGGSTFDIECYSLESAPLTNLGTTNGQLADLCDSTVGIRLTFCRDLCPDVSWTGSGEVTIDCGSP